MVDANTEQTIDRLLDLLEADPDFSTQLRKDFGEAIQVAGVPVSLDATRGFIKGSCAYSAEDPIELPGDYFVVPTSYEFFCHCTII
jgi:hypothetical protein